MNNIFSLTRFGKLFRKHTVENYKGYLMATVVLIGLMSAVYKFLLYVSGDSVNYNMRLALFYGFLLIAGSIFTSAIFTEYGHKERAIASMTLPASQFEKFLIGWVYSFPIFILVYLGCFYSIDFLFLRGTAMPDNLKAPINLFTGENRPYYALYFYGFFNAICLYGAIAFRKLHFIKTGFITFIVIAMAVYLNQQIIYSLIPGEVASKVPFTGVSLREGERQYFLIQLEPGVQLAYLRFTLLIVPVFLWIAAYFRIKEKQV